MSLCRVSHWPGSSRDKPLKKNWAAILPERRPKMLACVALLDGFAVQCEVETFALDFVGDAQPDDGLDDEQQDQRDDDVIDEDDADPDDLVEDLTWIAFEEARRAAILIYGEDAGEDRTRRAADRMDAEAVECVVIADPSPR
jgi:hypothetical protein